MKLSVRFLNDVQNVNSFHEISEWDISEGSAHKLYCQIIDKHKHFNEHHDLRYLSQASSISLKATFLSIDDGSEFAVTGSQPFTDDKSIWRFDLTASQVPNSGAVKFTLDEDGTESKFKVEGGVTVSLLDDGGC